MAQFNVQMPDGTIRSVQGTTLSAAINNAGAGASAPGAAPSGGGGGGGTPAPSAPSSVAAGAYQTINGPRTLQQMQAELANVGYGGPTDSASILSTYGRTSGQAVQPIMSGASGTAPVAVTTTGTSADTQKLIAGIQQLLGAQASGNKDAIAEAIREFNASFGLDTQKFQDDVRRFNENLAVTQAGLTGTYQGQPTLQAQNQAYTQQMGVINAAAALQANPFRQAQVIGQAGRVLQGLPTAGFQAPNVVSGVGTAGGNTQGGMGYLSQLIADIQDPTPNQTTAQSWLDATPTPNKLDSVSFLRSSPTTQNLILQAQQEKYGIDPQDSLKQIQATMPQFSAPNTTGTVRRG
jgi:hypothetical protein